MCSYKISPKSKDKRLWIANGRKRHVILLEFMVSIWHIMVYFLYDVIIRSRHLKCYVYFIKISNFNHLKISNVLLVLFAFFFKCSLKRRILEFYLRGWRIKFSIHKLLESLIKKSGHKVAQPTILVEWVTSSVIIDE